MQFQDYNTDAGNEDDDDDDDNDIDKDDDKMITMLALMMLIMGDVKCATTFTMSKQI